MKRNTRLTIIAATGGVSRELLEQAVATGHDVIAVVRDPRELSRPVRTVTADMAAADPAALEPATAGTDAVRRSPLQLRPTPGHRIRVARNQPSSSVNAKSLINVRTIAGLLRNPRREPPG